MSTAFVSARRGIRSRSIPASDAFCISAARSWRARRRKCWRCASPGPTKIARPCRRSFGRCRRRAALSAIRIISARCRKPSPNGSASMPNLVVRSLTGNLKISPEGAIRADNRYMLIGGDGVNRPDPVQAAWLYAQIVRWGQSVLTDELCAVAAIGVPARPLRCRARPRAAARQWRAVSTASAPSSGRASTPRRYRRPSRSLAHPASRTAAPVGRALTYCAAQ